MAHRGVMIRGRQILNMAFERYTQQQHMGALHTYEDLATLSSKGLSMEQFKAKWDFVMTEQAVKPDLSFLHQKLAKELRSYEQLKYTFNRYDEAEPGDTGYSYDYLYNAMDCFFVRKQKKDAREDEAKRAQNADQISTAPAPRGT